MDSERDVALLKAAVAALACVLVFIETRRRHAVSARAAKALALALAVVATIAYFEPWRGPVLSRVHHWEMFHYYLGSKYPRELGYQRLYECVAVADAESGSEREVARRRIRDLSDDSVHTAADALRDRGACKRLFSAQRWTTFVSDVRRFRDSAGSSEYWQAMQVDHGYNPSPVWTLVGHALSSSLEPTESALGWLARIDLLLMGGVVGVLAWGFGWRVAAVGVIFWGTQAASDASWTSGAFLRQDWLFLAALGLALLRKRYFFWAGVALVYSALLRVFPVMLWAGPLVLMGRAWRRHGCIPLRYRRMLLGGLAATAVLVPLGIATAGPRAYPEFFEHTAMHATTPVANHVSLKTLFGASDDPAERPPPSRNLAFGAHRTARAASAVALCALFAWTALGLRTVWVATALSLVLVVILTDPACYYYSLFVLAAPLSRVRRSLDAVLFALAAVGQLIVLRFSWDGDRAMWLAALYVVVSTIFALALARGRRAETLLVANAS